jgi:hypothetical protein
MSSRVDISEVNAVLAARRVDSSARRGIMLVDAVAALVVVTVVRSASDAARGTAVEVVAVLIALRAAVLDAN